MTSTDIAVPTDEDFGLGDLGDSEGPPVVRFSIDGKIPAFVNRGQGIELPDIDAVCIGAVRSRVLWSADMPENPKDSIPLCKSWDALLGHPDQGDEERKGTFPWVAVPPELKETLTEEGTIKCEDCTLKNWDTHPNGKKPWCSEQQNLVFQWDGGDLAVITFQRSSLKPATDYLKQFRGRPDKNEPGTPPFIVRTLITLQQRTRGQVTYAVPTFKRGEVTAQSNWDEFATNYRMARAYLATPRSETDEEGTTVTVAAEDNDFGGDLPF